MQRRAGAASCNATHQFGLIRHNGAGVDAGLGQSHRLKSYDAACVALLYRDGAFVLTAGDDGAHPAFKVHGAVTADLPVVLMIQIVFHGDGTCDAPCVPISLNGAVIGAGFHLAGGVLRGVGVGDIGDGAAQIFPGTADGAADGAGLLGDGLQIVR